jgi:DNA-binding protein YbaB
MDEESNRLAGLLNISTPANPGKPVPWTPRSAAHRPEPAAAWTPPGESAQAARRPERGPETQRPEGPAAQVDESASDEGPAVPPHWDPATVSEIFGRTVAAAEAQRARLEQAMAAARERTYVAEAADGEVRVTVDGRPRVTEVYVSARAVRNGPDSLGAAIAEAANAAVRAARDGANETLLDGLDPAMRAAVERGLTGPAGPAGPTG